MKKLRNYVILFTLVVFALTFNMQGVKASSILFDNDTTEETETENESLLDNEVSIENETTNESTTNSVIVNSLNNNLVKDNQVNTTPGNNDNLPQTGENDIYIVSAVGAIALIIGSVSYIKSRKYDI